jgi:hypothetical protein
VWALAAIGWLLGALAAEHLDRRDAARAAGRAGTALVEPTDPAEMSARSLRRMPGVGARRALAAARARWEHDPATGPLRWVDVPGIGQRTAERIAGWCRARGLRADGVFVPASPPPAALPSSP